MKIVREIQKRDMGAWTIAYTKYNTKTCKKGYKNSRIVRIKRSQAMKRWKG